MKNISPALKAFYQGEVLTIAKCWKVVRVDSKVFGFTDIDHDVVYDGITYLAGTGITPSAIQQADDFSVDNLNVDSILTDETISEQDLKNGLWDGAYVELFELNYEDLTMGINILRTGYLGNVTSGRIAFSAEIRGLSQLMQSTYGRVYSPYCDATLFDTRCGVIKAVYTVQSSVITADNQSNFYGVALGTPDYQNYPADWFTNGVVSFTGGQNTGFSAEIQQFDYMHGKVTLFQELPFPLQTGDTFEIWPGCNKSKEDCKNKFNNLTRFRGFPSIPGPDLLKSGQLEQGT